MLADRVNDTTTHFLVLTPYKSRSTRSTRPKAILRLSLGVSIMKMTESMTQQRISWSWHMDRLKKEYVQELLLLLLDWKATLRFSLGVSSWKWYGWANRSSVYIPYLFCQLCSDSSVRPLWGARMAQWLSTRLPTKWPGFKSRHQCHMWVGFVVGSLPSSERLFSGYSGFPLSLKPTFSNFSSTRNGSRTTTLYQLSC